MRSRGHTLAAPHQRQDILRRIAALLRSEHPVDPEFDGRLMDDHDVVAQQLDQHFILHRRAGLTVLHPDALAGLFVARRFFDAGAQVRE